MKARQGISTKQLRDNLSEILEKVAIGIKLEDHPAYGMWQDREERKDSAKWVSELRKKQSKRRW